MNLTSELIDFIVETDFEHLSKEVAEATKKLLIDTIGVALAGSGAAGIGPTIDLIRQWGGKPESTIWVFGDRLPSIHAAFVNSMMTHALDFDDTHGKVAIHAGSSVIPTALAMAEYVQDLNGRDLITSIVLGVEVASRLGLAILEQDKGWHLSGTCGAFASAAVAGKLLGLNKEKMWNALAIAYSQASGTLQSAIDGALTKRMQPGFGARSGIFSAFLARDGLTGSRDFLEGRYGFFKLYQSNIYDPSALTKDLGATFEILNLATKPYPCCRLAHSAIDAILEIIAESNFSLDEVEEITVYGSQAMKDLCGGPFEVGKNNEIDAQFSLSYLMVSAILRGGIDIKSFSKEVVRDPVLRQHTRKINIIVPPDISNRWATRIEVRKKDGSMLSNRVDIPKGQPENPMDWEECVEKFKRCSIFTAKSLSQNNLNQFIQRVKSLEDVDLVVKLVQFLV